MYDDKKNICVDEKEPEDFCSELNPNECKTLGKELNCKVLGNKCVEKGCGFEMKKIKFKGESAGILKNLSSCECETACGKKKARVWYVNIKKKKCYCLGAGQKQVTVSKAKELNK